MAEAKKNSKKTKIAPVDDYSERPLKDALADPEDIKRAEGRQPDQIVDYHKDRPTLGEVGVPDEAEQENLQQKAAESQQDALPGT